MRRMEGKAQGEGSRGLARGGAVVPWQGEGSNGGNLVGGSLKKKNSQTTGIVPALLMTTPSSPMEELVM